MTAPAVPPPRWTSSAPGCCRPRSRRTARAGSSGSGVPDRSPRRRSPPRTRSSPRRIAAVEPAAGVRLVPGAARGEAREYRVAGARSVAGHLLRDGVHPCLEPALRGLGAALAALHALPPPAHRPARRPGGWPGSTPGCGAARSRRWAAQAAAVLRERLGPDRWAALCAWAARAVGEPGRGAAHGAPGLGSVVFDPTPGVAEILVGEDLCARRGTPTSAG